jgi:hypothetical protein
VSDLDELRLEVAAERGLPASAVSLLTGETVEQIERSADQLANLVGRRDPEPEAGPLAGMFANAAADKQRRNRALIQALHGPGPQPRDDHGRFVSFDGGARTPAPTGRSPVEEHDQLIVRNARISRALGGGFAA